MNRRLIALLLALVLGLQSVLAPAAMPSQDEHATQAHCTEMDAAHAAETSSPPASTHGNDCPCCQGMAAGCTTSCFVAAACPCCPLCFLPDLCDDRVIAAPPSFLDRLDIPPTPPPIG